jgi:hypothetical protein
MTGLRDAEPFLGIFQVDQELGQVANQPSVVVKVPIVHGKDGILRDGQLGLGLNEQITKLGIPALGFLHVLDALRLCPRQLAVSVQNMFCGAVLVVERGHELLRRDELFLAGFLIKSKSLSFRFHAGVRRAEAPLSRS